MPFLTQGKTNWKYILIVLILAIIVGGGILTWQRWMAEEKEVKVPEEKPTTEELSLNLITTKLATIPGDHEVVEGPIFSPNGRKVAYVAKTENKYFVVVNGKEGKAYDEIAGVPLFSPNSQKMAYIAKKDCMESTIELEGKEYPIKTGCKELVVINDEEGKVYNKVHPPIFSPDSQKIVYEAIKERNFFIVVNGEEKDEGYPIFSPDSHKIAYITREGEQRFIVVNGKEGKKYDAISHLIFSPDSQKIAYIAEKEDGYFTVVNGEEGKTYYLIFGPPVFSPDSQKIAYKVRKRDEIKWFIVVNGEEGKIYDDVGAPIFSPDSNKIAYRAKKEGRFSEVIVGNERTCLIVVNGKESKSYDDVWDPVFSPDSQKLAYRARRSRKEDAGTFLVIDGEEIKTHATSDSPTYTPIFSPDSQKIAYVDMEDNKRLIVINGKKSKAYDRIYTKPKFTSDGQYIVYGAKLDNELWWVADEVE